MPKRDNGVNPRKFLGGVERVIEKVIVGTQFLQWVLRGEFVNSANGRLLRSEEAPHSPNSVP